MVFVKLTELTLIIIKNRYVMWFKIILNIILLYHI